MFDLHAVILILFEVSTPSNPGSFMGVLQEGKQTFEYDYTKVRRPREEHLVKRRKKFAGSIPLGKSRAILGPFRPKSTKKYLN